jgi:hypothetical protein
LLASGELSTFSALLRAGLVVSLPVAGIVAAATVQAEADRAFVVAVVAIAWAVALATIPRVRWAVAVASAGGAILAIGWALLVWLEATPCGLSGRGILQATPQCPVQATHVVGLLSGGASCVALVVGVVGGVRYVRLGDQRALRLFRTALLVAAVLMLVWLAADLILPRNAPSD